MYTVSEKYLLAMKRPVRYQRLRGIILSQEFTDEDILAGSFTYQNQASDSSDIKFGSSYIGKLTFTLINTSLITKGNYQNAEIKVNYELLTDYENQDWESVPIGVFHIESALWSEVGIEITAFDNMAAFNKPINATTTNGLPFEILSQWCNSCHVSLGMSSEDFSDFPNGQTLLSAYSDNDISTYQDGIFYIAQALGAFATMNRQGKLVLRRFSTSPIDEVDTTRRITGSKFSDFETLFTAVSITDLQTGTLKKYTVGRDNGTTMSLGMNPFLQYGLEEAVEEMRRNVLTAANELRFIPFTTSMAGNPAYDLGDCINFVGGIAGDSICSIQQINWKFSDKQSMAGFGANPALSNVESKAEKQSSANTISSRNDLIRYFTYTNSNQIEIGENEIRVANIQFANSKETFVEMWAQIQLQTELDTDSSSMEVEATFIIDGVEEEFYPIETYTDSAFHLFSVHWVKELPEVHIHTFELKLKALGGTILIAPTHSQMTIKGQGLDSVQGWDGFIEASDKIPDYLASLKVQEIADSLENLQFYIPNSLSGEDEVSIYENTLDLVSLSIQNQVLLEMQIYELVEEASEVVLTTEEGDTLLMIGG